MQTVTLLTAFAATGLLALGMPVHARVAFIGERWKKSLVTTAWKGAGWLLVALTLMLVVQKLSWGVGVVFWLLALAATGFGVTLLLTYRPRFLPVAVVGALSIAGIMSVALP
ncbi:MAG: DUF3325 domain-containing protein [Nibricoccus sp.]